MTTAPLLHNVWILTKTRKVVKRNFFNDFYTLCSSTLKPATRTERMSKLQSSSIARRVAGRSCSFRGATGRRKTKHWTLSIIEHWPCDLQVFGFHSLSLQWMDDGPAKPKLKGGSQNVSSLSESNMHVPICWYLGQRILAILVPILHHLLQENLRLEGAYFIEGCQFRYIRVQTSVHKGTQVWCVIWTTIKRL